jgi:HEAT repeat protein
MTPILDRRLLPEAAAVQPNRRYLTGLRALFILIACCATIFWAGRAMWDHRDPLGSEERALERGNQVRALDALQSRNATERVAAVEELGRYGFAQMSAIAVRPLTKMLRDEDSAVRAAAAEALVGIGAHAIETGGDGESLAAAVAALLRLLGDPDPAVRSATATALGAIAGAQRRLDSSSVAGAAASPKSNAAAVSMPNAATSAPIDVQSVTAALEKALGDQDATVRAAAVVARGACADDSPPQALDATLNDELAENRKLTVATVARFRRGLDSWMPSLLRMAEHDSDRSVRETCVNTLALIHRPSITPACIPALLAGLGGHDRLVKIEAAQHLAEFGTLAEAAIPALLHVLAEPIDDQSASAVENRENLSGAAASALGQIAPGSVSAEAVIRELIVILGSGGRTSQRHAADVLSNFGSAASAAIPELIRMVKDSGATHAVENEQAAGRALGLVAPETRAADEVVIVLMPLLDSNCGLSRIAAIEALKRFGGNAVLAIPKIRALRNDSDLEVKRVAASALTVLEDSSEP